MRKDISIGSRRLYAGVRIGLACIGLVAGSDAALAQGSATAKPPVPPAPAATPAPAVTPAPATTPSPAATPATPSAPPATPSASPAPAATQAPAASQAPAPSQAPAAPPAPAAVPAPPSAPPATAPAPTTAASNCPSRLYIEDGQVRSDVFTVFVTERVDDSMNPRLSLVEHGRATGATASRAAADQGSPRPLTPRCFPGQTRIVDVGGAHPACEGSILLFDLGDHHLEFYKSAVRIRPILEWTTPASGTAPAASRRIVADEEVYLGNMTGAALWTLAAMVVMSCLLYRWSRSKSAVMVQAGQLNPGQESWLYLISGPDNYLSLWRTQLLLWTYAVGSMVFLFGLTRLKVPEIPESLVALMGLSLTTGLSAAIAAKPKDTSQGSGTGANPAPTSGSAPATGASPPATGASPPATQATGASQTPYVPVPSRKTKPEWSDLISVWNATKGGVELSIPKAQMVIWTFVVLALFFAKSLLGGALWPVPWELVALTGISQAGYIGDKLVSDRPPRTP